jgi:transposase
MFQPLSDTQWDRIAPLFPPPPPRKLNRGRKRANYRHVLDSLLWILHTGAGWKDLPKGEGFVAFQTAHRYLQSWDREGIFFTVVNMLASEMKINLEECFIDGTFIPAKGGVKKSVMVEKAREAPLN